MATLTPPACTADGDSQSGHEGASCVLDGCVASATDTASGIECCVDAHGRGLEGDDADALARGCEGDACDPSLYLSEAAALCAAQVCGLPVGISTCTAWFQFSEGAGSWSIKNNEEECEPDANMCGGGKVVEVDALTGACIGSGGWSN